MRILGIDPGYGITGFGLIEAQRGTTQLLRCGAMAAQMTGSGPTVFGLFQDLEQAETACRMLSERYAETYLSEFV